MAYQLRHGTRDPASWRRRNTTNHDQWRSGTLLHGPRGGHAWWRNPQPATRHMTAHIRCMAAGVHDPRLSVRCNYDIRRRRTPNDALSRPLTTEFAVVRFEAAYSATRRHETPRDDMRRLDTIFIIIIILGVVVRVIKEGGWAHWSLASLTFYHLYPVALDLYNGCSAIPRSPHASHGLAVTFSWATKGGLLLIPSRCCPMAATHDLMYNSINSEIIKLSVIIIREGSL